MSFGSLIGFGLVFIAVSMTASGLLGSALIFFGKYLRPLGPWTQRRAAALSLSLPPIFGLGIAITIAIKNLFAFYAGEDHCLGHGHHLHLCPFHGTEWLDEAWAVAAVAFFATFILVRLGQIVLNHAKAAWATRQLRRATSPLPQFEHVFIVPNKKHFAFTIGIFSPTIMISRSAWDSLDTDQREAVIAHESAHIKNGDVWKRTLLGLAACFGIPVLTQRVIQLWETSTERICDTKAAGHVGKPSIVASAIVSLSRSKIDHQTPAVAVFAAACSISERVHSLFERPIISKRYSQKLLIALLMATVILSFAAAIFAESLHHFLETILG